MIGIVRLKRSIAVLLALVAVVGGVGLLRQVSEAVRRAGSGADPTDVFHDVPPAPSEVVRAIRWLPDPSRDGRRMEPSTRERITDAYARALEALDRVGRGATDVTLRDHLTGAALDAALASVDATDRVDVATIHVAQSLRLDFYSDDGSIAAVGVPSVELVRVLGPDDRRTVVATDEAWRLVLVLQDGDWRIEQLETVAVRTSPVVDAPRALARAVDGVNSTTISGGDRTWRAFDEEAAARDLDVAATLGFGAVRVFVGGPELGVPDTDALLRFLDLAADRGLDVVLVLFDGSADHGPLGWRDDRAYLEHVVGPLAEHPAIVLWDLKNEADLDDVRSGGADVVDAWLRRVAADVRALDQDSPVTIGWSRAEAAGRAVDAIDVVSFHHFDGADALRDGIHTVTTVAGGRPVIVSEYGSPEWVGFVRGRQPAAQARRLAALREAVATAGVGGMVWQLRDPETPIEPGPIAGRASTSYGLLRADGSERPTADVVRQGRPGVPASSTTERLRASLPWITLVALVVVTLVLVALVVLVGRRRRAVRRDRSCPLGEADRPRGALNET